MLDLKGLITEFMNHLEPTQDEIYNEFSFQHMLGIFLRDNLEYEGYKVQFERNVEYFAITNKGTVKKEMDISIFNANKSEKYAIELKFPRKGKIPEQMYGIAKDVKFLEELKANGFNKGVSVTWVDDHLYSKGDKEDGIYQYFRVKNELSGEFVKPTGKKYESFTLTGRYDIKWTPINDKGERYFMVEV